jgi:hypothetical protein
MHLLYKHVRRLKFCALDGRAQFDKRTAVHGCRTEVESNEHEFYLRGKAISCSLRSFCSLSITLFSPLILLLSCVPRQQDESCEQTSDPCWIEADLGRKKDVMIFKRISTHLAVL